MYKFYSHFDVYEIIKFRNIESFIIGQIVVIFMDYNDEIKIDMKLVDNR